MSLRIRRGVSTDLPTPVEGELLYTTDNGNLYVGFLDPSTNTVVPRLTSGQLIDDPNPTLAANLDLAGNNIVGVGNIQIDGTVFASGEINLGDGVDDNVIVGGQIGSDLIPNADDAYDLGTQNVRWRNGYFEGISVDGEITASNFRTNSIQLQDSTTLFDGDTNSLTVDFIDANTIFGDLTGSIIGEDSETVLDVTSSNLSVESLNTNILDSKDDTLIILTENNDGINIASYNNNLASPAPFQAGEAISSIAFQIIEDELIDRKLCVGIAPFLSDDSDVSSVAPSSEIRFVVGDNTALGLAATISSKGIISEKVIQTGSYDSPTNYPADAEAGSILFDTSDNHFYGYNGTSWVQLDN